ncbi:LexA family protein [Streptomyces sp. NPDC059398]|uniref:LexA family protein n=1 Tax=Streptomyces sp. NPDC059398 TaxID=3346820 RepID=UPI0036B14548
MKDITDRQARILRRLRNSVAEHGRYPTMREIGDTVDLSSTSSVHYQLQRLAVPRVRLAYYPGPAAALNRSGHSKARPRRRSGRGTVMSDGAGSDLPVLRGHRESAHTPRML